MQIDVLSKNTLKLTLTRFDMYDFDIKYESLSANNPDTRRLLSKVLHTVRLGSEMNAFSKSEGELIDFSNGRLFVEAFPRKDGGCMLYISNLSDKDKNRKEDVRLTATDTRDSRVYKTPISSEVRSKPIRTNLSGSKTACLVYSFNSIKSLLPVCRCLLWLLRANDSLKLDSVLYTKNTNKDSEYRLIIKTNNEKLVTKIALEYGEILEGDTPLPQTREHYNLIIGESAVEKVGDVA